MKVCDAMVGLGHEIKLWLPGSTPDIDWAELGEHYGLNERFDTQWLKSPRSFRRYDFCARAVLAARNWGAQLFYTWPYQAAAAAARAGLPTLLEVHDRPSGTMGPRLFRAFLRGRGAKRLLLTTQALQEWLESEYSLSLQEPFGRITPNGIDLHRYRDLPPPEQARSAAGLREGFTAGYTGHFYQGRGINMMFDLARMNPGMNFLWVGGEEKTIGRWRLRLDEAGLENVQLLGFVPNARLPGMQAACDVLLMPYQRRIAVSSGGDTASFANPMKTFEYLASGRAIVSSDLPILREILNEQNSILIPPEDIEGWDLALKRLKAEPELRLSLGEHAREDAQKYSWKERQSKALEGLP
jgi:glycosyltransferase involved in cell wall biosynthesis